jgi:hypothetical protein
MADSADHEEHGHAETDRESAGAVASTVVGDRQDHGQQDQIDNSVTAQCEPEGEGCRCRHWQQQNADELTLRGGIQHAETGEQADQTAEHHGNDQHVAVEARHLSGLGRGKVCAVRLDLQGVGEVNEDPFSSEDGRDSHSVLQGEPQPSQTRVRGDETIKPTVSNSRPAGGRGRQW